jgi:hypothetical protein
MMAMGIRGTGRIISNLHPDEDAVLPVAPMVMPVMFHMPPRVAINMMPGAVMRVPLYLGARPMTRIGLRRYAQQKYGTCEDDSGNELF